MLKEQTWTLKAAVSTDGPINQHPAPAQRLIFHQLAFVHPTWVCFYNAVKQGRTVSIYGKVKDQ
jgi:hypothetical protein